MTDYFTQVSDYVEGRLSPSAIEAFEAELIKNEELQQAVDNHDVMDLALDMLWEDDARLVAERALKEAEQPNVVTESTQKKEAKIFPLKKALAVAASLAVLVVIGYIMMNNLGPAQEQLYAAHKLNPLDLDIIKGATKGVSQSNHELNLVDQAHVLIDNKKYSEASQILETIRDEEQIEKAQYLLVLAYLMQDDSKKRDSVLSRILGSQKHLYKKKAQDLSADL